MPKVWYYKLDRKTPPNRRQKKRRIAMEKEYVVLNCSNQNRYFLENTLNNYAEAGYEYCGMSTIQGSSSAIIMRKMPEMDNSDISDDLYEEETPEQKKARIDQEMRNLGW